MHSYTWCSIGSLVMLFVHVICCEFLNAGMLTGINYGTEWNGMSSGIVAHVDFNMGIGPALWTAAITVLLIYPMDASRVNLTLYSP